MIDLWKLLNTNTKSGLSLHERNFGLAPATLPCGLWSHAGCRSAALYVVNSGLQPVLDYYTETVHDSRVVAIERLIKVEVTFA